MVTVEDKTTITVSKDMRGWLTLLKLEIQAAKKKELARDKVVRLALACVEQHKEGVL
ncbi:MAG: hypothetical protein ACXW02_08425 [Halobacteriota archaeon]